MALTGKFIADFSSFQDAVAKAEVSLKGFETGANKVGSTLNRMTEQFSGRKVITEATLMSEVFSRAGGAATFTKDELSRMSTVGAAAIAKLHATGQPIPLQLQQMATEASRASLTFRDMATAAAAIAGIVAGLSLAVGKLGERGAGVNDVSASFRDLTGQIGESSDALLGRLRTATLGTISDFQLMQTANLSMSQGLALSAEQFGTVGDTAAVLADRMGIDVKTAFDTLSQAMATGQDRTLKTIGLNIDAEKATRDYAASIGKQVKDLDESEKKHAIQNAILAEGQRIIALSGKAQKDFGDQVAGSSAKMSNFVDRISAWVATSPSIGAWTSTITAASSTVTAMGLAFGPVSAGLTKLLPLLGLSGITGAFASLGTVITATVIPALGTAFALLTPFLVPLAAVAAAVGVVYLAWKNWDTIVPIVKGVYDGVKTWFGDNLGALLAFGGPVLWPIASVVTIWKNWDQITEIVKNVYLGVKTWMSDKLGAVFDFVKGKIDFVTGAFKNMYDKVVGQSFVPDMVEGIAAEFGRLDSVMVNPTRAVTDKVIGLFSGLTNKLSGLLGGNDSIFGKILSGGLGALFGSGGPLMKLVGMGMEALSGLVWKGVQKIGGWIKGLFSGGEIGTVVNPSRDAWFGGRGVQDVGNQLAPFMDGEQARLMIERVFNAKNRDELASSTGAIDKILQSNSFAGGTGGKFIDFGRGTPAILHGREKIVKEGDERTDERPIVIIVKNILDGRELSESIVPYFPAAVQRFV